MYQRPITVQMLCVGQVIFAERVDGFFHWVKGIGFTCQNAELDQLMKCLG